MLDSVIAFLQYLLPRHALSGIAYKLTRIRNKTWKNLLINTFIRFYKVDMKQAISSEVDDYASFNDFFTRELRSDARTWQLNSRDILSPVDCRISQIGNLNTNRLVQAKGKHFLLETLLANDLETAKHFIQGTFATLYLSPRDYHRIHMPVTAQLIRSIFVPGDLLALNNPSIRTIDGLFAKNERFISIFKSQQGLMAQIMVGALFVGSMETVWLGQITPTRKREITIRDYREKEILLKQGELFGHFNMGSTVILLFEKDTMEWRDDMTEGKYTEVGQVLGRNLV